MIDSDGFAELVARRSVLYHRCWNSDEAKVASILEHGLEGTYSGYKGFWVSRPGRAFLKSSPDVPEPKHPHDSDQPGGAEWTLFEVQTAKLEQRRFEPDEDCFLNHNFIDHASARAGERETKRHRIPFAPSQWLWEWGRFLGMACPTLAEWADAVDLGSDPQATRATIMANKTLSYRGVVPATALRLVASGVGHSENRHVCREPVDESTWSIDHIHALSLRGRHAAANVKLAHRLCNSLRGARCP